MPGREARVAVVWQWDAEPGAVPRHCPEDSGAMLEKVARKCQDRPVPSGLGSPPDSPTLAAPAPAPPPETTSRPQDTGIGFSRSGPPKHGGRQGSSLGIPVPDPQGIRTPRSAPPAVPGVSQVAGSVGAGHYACGSLCGGAGDGAPRTPAPIPPAPPGDAALRAHGIPNEFRLMAVEHHVCQAALPPGPLPPPFAKEKRPSRVHPGSNMAAPMFLLLGLSWAELTLHAGPLKPGREARVAVVWQWDAEPGAVPRHCPEDSGAMLEKVARKCQDRPVPSGLGSPPDSPTLAAPAPAPPPETTSRPQDTGIGFSRSGPPKHGGRQGSSLGIPVPDPQGIRTPRSAPPAVPGVSQVAGSVGAGHYACGSLCGGAGDGAPRTPAPIPPAPPGDAALRAHGIPNEFRLMAVEHHVCQAALPPGPLPPPFAKEKRPSRVHPGSNMAAPMFLLLGLSWAELTLHAGPLMPGREARVAVVWQWDAEPGAVPRHCPEDSGAMLEKVARKCQDRPVPSGLGSPPDSPTLAAPAPAPPPETTSRPQDTGIGFSRSGPPKHGGRQGSSLGIPVPDPQGIRTPRSAPPAVPGVSQVAGSVGAGHYACGSLCGGAGDGAPRTPAPIPPAPPGDAALRAHGIPNEFRLMAVEHHVCQAALPPGPLPPPFAKEKRPSRVHPGSNMAAPMFLLLGLSWAELTLHAGPLMPGREARVAVVWQWDAEPGAVPRHCPEDSGAMLEKVARKCQDRPVPSGLGSPPDSPTLAAPAPAPPPETTSRPQDTGIGFSRSGPPKHGGRQGSSLGIPVPDPQGIRTPRSAPPAVPGVSQVAGSVGAGHYACGSLCGGAGDGAPRTPAPIPPAPPGDAALRAHGIPNEFRLMAVEHHVCQAALPPGPLPPPFAKEKRPSRVHPGSNMAAPMFLLLGLSWAELAQRAPARVPEAPGSVLEPIRGSILARAGDTLLWSGAQNPSHATPVPARASVRTPREASLTPRPPSAQDTKDGHPPRAQQRVHLPAQRPGDGGVPGTGPFTAASDSGQLPREGQRPRAPTGHGYSRPTQTLPLLLPVNRPRGHGAHLTVTSTSTAP
ncbi:basic proline-rich protein-like [Neovison vison]|uniref:basic proline-rich protein-like n=1 Tax=Neovison vison TaxID=452646 RepID=UPI001CF08CBF|nr:basic proline-rich protein-like [Neogale vison]